MAMMPRPEHSCRGISQSSTRAHTDTHRQTLAAYRRHFPRDLHRRLLEVDGKLVETIDRLVLTRCATCAMSDNALCASTYRGTKSFSCWCHLRAGCHRDACPSSPRH